MQATDYDRLAEFFADDGPYRPPQYPLQQSPVAALIKSVDSGGTTWYSCALHPGLRSAYWETVEHHIKYTPGYEHFHALTSDSS